MDRWKRSDVTDEQVVAACAAARETGPTGPTSLQRLMSATGAPAKVCTAAMQRAADRGVIECGVSLRTAWPARDGR
jgi:sulfur relay (sulfurtransferase) complex TusBCD TusD component (DsrE family)